MSECVSVCVCVCVCVCAASCLVPLSDMFNMAKRKEDVNVRCDTNENSTHFECRTTTTVSIGTQVYILYYLGNE